MTHERKIKTELYNDHFQNFKRYNIPKAQLVIADIPYNLGNNAYASSPSWYKEGDNKNGESEKAGKQFFDTDKDFNLNEYMHFCSKLLRKEPKEKGESPSMVVFCSFEQMQTVIDVGKKHGFEKNIPLVFIKNYSAQVLKANMKIVGATEYAVLLYRSKLPKFRNEGKMIYNWFNWRKDTKTPQIHPTQKPIEVVKQLIRILTDKGDVVIDPVAGSAVTLRAAHELKRSSYGFEIKKDFYKLAKEKMLTNMQETLF